MACSSLGGRCVRMLVVPLVVTALYRRGFFRRAVERIDIFKNVRAHALVKWSCGKDKYPPYCDSLCAGESNSH